MTMTAAAAAAAATTTTTTTTNRGPLILKWRHVFFDLNVTLF